MDQYFKSYEELDIHQLMLSDKTRVLAYKTAIFNSREKFQGKIVMDVGAGSGILSIFCAQVGAKKVYAVEASMLAKSIEQVSIENNMQDKVEAIHSKVEDIRPDSLEKVDVIVSEWMGFHLVHEGMLDSVLFARDNFLHEDGLLFPSVAKLYASPCQLPSMYEFWNNVCGVSMSCIGKEYRKMKSLKPEILLLNQDDLLAEGKLLAWLDLKCVSVEEIDLLGGEDYVSVCEKDGRFQGMCIWFAVEFPDGSELSTGPRDEATHWKHTAVVLPEDMEVTRNEPIAFKLEFKRNESHPRRYNMELSLLDVEEVEHDVPCNCHMTKCIVTKKYIDDLDERESCAAENNDL
ncbi:probable protein arginine N-methyltransferase 6.1 [Temnothorax curvispinosus]|uniref:type I protein arginine methyltransferase n=1 Tax=Temnothorax curvispinosus TaxID=300111 RepID=A0A6J1PV36_9HYME|nr:probable protein arginine N-methyltransferase 6.1 [Temnothorax curvispinosus]XP_024873076.1 probable protein arginine N-methyltransferase 6.1 [Temnothorax curvispinosus]